MFLSKLNHAIAKYRHQKSAALICNDPKHAQVILVDSTSPQGKRFIRDWGRDEDKIVLEYTWVSRCFAAQKLLKEPDQWGGCMTQDDGSSLEGDEGDQPVKCVYHSRPSGCQAEHAYMKSLVAHSQNHTG